MHIAPDLRRTILTASGGFTAVSLCVFASVAFAERWMYQHLTMIGAYLVWTILFIGLGGAVLGTLVAPSLRRKFYLLYALAFLVYAFAWVGAYFSFRGTAGEWIASLAGSIAMSLVFAVGFKRTQSTLMFSALLFVANSLGYFLGSILNEFVRGKTGMLLWGLAYGLFLGAGLGAILHLAQVERTHS